MAGADRSARSGYGRCERGRTLFTHSFPSFLTFSLSEGRGGRSSESNMRCRRRKASGELQRRGRFGQRLGKTRNVNHVMDRGGSGRMNRSETRNVVDWGEAGPWENSAHVAGGILLEAAFRLNIIFV